MIISLFLQIIYFIYDRKLKLTFFVPQVLAAFDGLLSHHVDLEHISELQQYLAQQPSASSTDDEEEEEDSLDSFLDDTPVKTSCWGPSRKKQGPQGPIAASTPIAASKATHGDFRLEFLKNFIFFEHLIYVKNICRCGSCQVFFDSDCELVTHVKRKHLRVKALMRPLYGCGNCSAVFYRNSFILRHHRLHHTHYD
jgi:hypothetical protein